MKRALVRVFVTVAVVAGGAEVARGKDLVFASGGLGGGSRGLARFASLTFIRGSTVFSVRASMMYEFSIFGPSPSESASDVGLLFGRALRKGRVASYAAAGIGYVHTVRRGRLISDPPFFGREHERIETRTIGIPVDLRLTVNAKGVGIGLSLFGNVNREDSFAGAALTLQLGRVR